MPLPALPYAPEAPRALKNIRVLDLSRLVAGNVLTGLLADHGATVIKVEPPEGDPLRAWKVAGVSTWWPIYGRGKLSVCLDLRQAPAMAALRAMIPEAQVLVESFRPGTLEKMGLAPEALLAMNPKLVIVRISGWGQDGPYALRPGFGTLVEGMSGFAAGTGFPDREPVLPPTALADMVAGITGAFGTLTAILSGVGQVVDVPLLDPMVHVMGPQAADYRLSGKVKPRSGSRSTNAAPRNVYRTADDKWVAISASMQVMVDRLFHAIGRPELITHPDYATNALRVKNGVALDAIIAGFIATRTQAEALAHFEAADVTCMPVYNIAELLEDPHVAARGIFSEVPDAAMGSYPMPAIVPRLSATPGALRTPAPRLGEHTRAVLGIAAEALLASGAAKET
jgi:crotonobetainyl-CoA:carnitine CoA-transferase CaiB-like acyl-CoA transferase